MTNRNEVNTILSTVGSALGVTIALQDVYTILGIIITILNISIVIYNLIVKLHQKFTNKEYDEIDDILQDTVNQLENIKKEGEKDECKDSE